MDRAIDQPRADSGGIRKERRGAEIDGHHLLATGDSQEFGEGHPRRARTGVVLASEVDPVAGGGAGADGGDSGDFLAGSAALDSMAVVGGGVV